MEEVQRIHKAVEPVETLFVIDSMTGQDALTSADHFNQALALTGVVLTKADSDARGGAVLSAILHAFYLCDLAASCSRALGIELLPGYVRS